MKMNKRIAIALFFISSFSFAQTDSLEVNFVDSLITETDFVANDSLAEESSITKIVNAEVLTSFIEKLYKLDTQKGRKINILHIGDSHIQADLMTGRLRQEFQSRFGNAGLGFVFPHTLAKTNGSSNLKFSSNISWNSLRNIYPDDGKPVGLSGIALFTDRNDFAIELQVRNAENKFNHLKIITPNNKISFSLADAKKAITLTSNTPKVISHKIKSGETLSGIASRYKTTVAKIKQSNKLKNNNIRAGATLIIHTAEMQAQQIEKTDFIPLEVEPVLSDYYYEYQNLDATDKIYLIPNAAQDSFALNGLVLENNQSGVLYHSIGVNGAKYSDYNKYPLFFEQINALNPDLIIISLGTNEAFDKLCDQCFFDQIQTFLSLLREKNPDTTVLLTTPPPSLFKRKLPNVFCDLYADVMLRNASEYNYAVWDLYHAVGGNKGMDNLIKNGLIAKDRVHYSSSGYQQQGVLLFEALKDIYNDYLVEAPVVTEDLRPK